MPKPSAKPSGRELEVLGVLWDLGPATTRQVLEALPDGQRLAYTTVLSIMQGMEPKGLLKRDSAGVAHIWRPAVTRRQVMGPMLQRLVRNAFGGRTSEALQHLLAEGRIDADELAEIRRLLDNHGNDRKKH